MGAGIGLGMDGGRFRMGERSRKDGDTVDRRRSWFARFVVMNGRWAIAFRFGAVSNVSRSIGRWIGFYLFETNTKDVALELMRGRVTSMSSGRLEEQHIEGDRR